MYSPATGTVKKTNPLEKATPTLYSLGAEHLESSCTCGRSRWIPEPGARPGRALHAPSTRSCCFSAEPRSTPRPRKGQGLTRGNRPPAAGLSLPATATPREAGEGGDVRQNPGSRVLLPADDSLPRCHRCHRARLDVVSCLK